MIARGTRVAPRLTLTTTTERRVLLVTYHYPPDQEVGALRGEKLVKYLPEYGWRPDVLTVDPRHYDHAHPASMVPGIARTRVLPTSRELYARLRRWYLRRSGGDAAMGVGLGQDVPFVSKSGDHPGLFAAVKRTVLSIAWWPDCASGWWGPAVVAGRRLMRTCRYAGLITTGPPHTAHLVGLALRRRGLRWIVDLRDPWVRNPGTPGAISSAASDALDRWCERAVLERADAIVVGTDWLQDEVAGRYPHLADRLHVIPAGIDTEDFAGISRTPADKFRVAHLGSLYFHRSPGILFAALEELLADGTLARDQTEIVLAGECSDGIDPVGLARRHGLDDLLRLPGLIPRAEALAVMASAGALVLFAQRQPLQVPAKLYEYLAAGPPVIAVADPGATADLVAQSGRGWVVGPSDRAAMRRALLVAHGRWRQRHDSGDQGPPSIAASLDRRLLTGHLVALMEGTPANGQASPVRVHGLFYRPGA